MGGLGARTQTDPPPPLVSMGRTLIVPWTRCVWFNLLFSLGLAGRCKGRVRNG